MGDKEPVHVKCPKCGHEMYTRATPNKEGKVTCSNKECFYKFNLEENKI